jgi:hypothetical protein
MTPMSSIQLVREEAARHGLAVRTMFAPCVEDAVPPVAEGSPARTLALVGNVGSSLWAAFSASPEFVDGHDHPLDRWSRRLGEEIARRCGGLALFPFGGPPDHPFQRWALRTGTLFASPVGLLIDPKYGLWHAFRFAIALPDQIEEPVLPAGSPCLNCSAQPCLKACPVTAFVEGEYRYRQCIDHLVAHGDAQCWRIGCLARHACPVGQTYRYLPAHANFHMSAFVAKRRQPDGGLGLG